MVMFGAADHGKIAAALAVGKFERTFDQVGHFVSKLLWKGLSIKNEDDVRPVLQLPQSSCVSTVFSILPFS